MPKVREYLAIIPDLPGVLQKRLSVRPTHIEGVRTSFAKGILSSGGGLSDEFTDPLSLNGSAVSVYAESKEEALEFLASDIYAKEGVWDLKNAKIYAYHLAVRKSSE